MPRIRTIKPKFWDDIKLSKISRDARLLFIGIWNFSDDLGVIIAEPVWIKSKVFPYDILEQSEFDNWLQELIDKKFIISISHNKESFFYIRTFDRHQKINKPNNLDLYIDKQSFTSITDQSRINPVLISDESGINQGRNNSNSNNNKGIIKEGDSVINHQMPLASNFNGLPDIQITSAREFVRITSQVNITEKDVKDIWEVFKVQNLTGKKFYQDNEAVYNHFGNWIKKQDFKKKQSKNGSNNGALSNAFIEVPKNINYESQEFEKW